MKKMNYALPSAKGLLKQIMRASLFVYSGVLIVCSALICTSCATTNSSNHKPTGDIDWKFSPEGETTFQFLRFYNAIIENDSEESVNAANKLAKLVPTPSALAETARFLLMQGQVIDARSLVQTGLDIDPKDESLNFILAETYTQEKRYNDALEILVDYQKSKKVNPEVQQETARLYLLSQRNKEAEKYILSLPERGPILDYYLAQAYIELDDLSKAEQYLLKSVQKAPDFVQPLTSLAMLYERQQKWQKSAQYRKKLYDLNPDKEDVKGAYIFNLIQGENFKAINSILDNKPQSTKFLLDIAGAMLSAKQFTQAEVLLKKIIDGKGVDTPAENNSDASTADDSMDGQDNQLGADQGGNGEGAPKPAQKEDAYYLLAVVAYESKQDTLKVLNLLSRVPVSSRYYGNALILSAHILMEQNKPLESLERLDAGMKNTPENVNLWKTKADVLLFTKQFPEAIAFLKEATAQFKDDPALAYSLGAVLEETGQKDEAMKVMEGIVERFPYYAGALNYIGYVLADENRDLQRANQLLELAYTQDPDSFHIVDSLAWVKYRLKDYDKAWRLIKRSVELMKNDEAVVWEHYGDIASALGKKEEAQKGYRNALKNNPKNATELEKKLANIS